MLGGTNNLSNQTVLNSYNTSTLRCASDLFTTTVFRKAVREKDIELFMIRANRLLELCPNIKINSVSDIISNAYTILSDEYRIEYFYKNTILNELLTDDRFIQDSVVVFNEFKIHRSIADVVYINGKNRVYEIKTELDTPERLKNQINDYKKMFSEVNIVTHFSLYNKYSQIIDDESIGIFILNENLKIDNIRKAKIDNTKLDLEIMLKTLKKKELISLIANTTGEQIQTPNMSFLDKSLDMLSRYDLCYVQKKVFEYLKYRGIKEIEMLLKRETISELKYICLASGFSKNEYEHLYTFLNSNFK